MQALNWRTAMLCFAAGALLVAGFAPLSWYPLSFLCVAALFYCWLDLSPRASFLSGLAFGYGLYGVGVSWVYVSLSTYGGMPFWMGSIAVLGFASLLAFFIAATGWLTARFFPHHRLLVLPFIWTVFEWMQSWVLTGFPWIDLGYTQTESWLFALAPVGGIYLISFAICVIASCLVWMVQRKTPLPAGIIVLVLAVSFALDQVQWAEPAGSTIKVGIVQPNTPIEKKWQSNFRDGLLQRLAQQSADLKSQSSAELIIWPETALPLYLQQTDTAFWQSMVPKGAAVLTGIMDSPSLFSGNLDESYNAAVLLCDGEPQVYRKRHLVPFGEYMPLRFVFGWVLDYLELPMSDFSSWQGQQPLNCGTKINVGLSICYEDAFAAEHRAHVGDATLLVNISEDAWFGDSLAPHQRLQMAQMRARELARPLVRSANSGPSVVISERGQVLAKTGQFVADSLSYEVQPMQGETPFKRFGNWIIWICVGLPIMLWVALWVRRNKSARRDT